uniref:Major facilitator superfamily (MFS) profile domain-containing protein n=1 Tax=Mucochytrium quahogii TaxID=96639 RepID=A0A7S2RTP0_9STRA|mmetsp:Transcript_190/g.392  ORF Transcript_190/g.392 Transcript_190/m.392 type:complete len:317 (+) Transcript_190:652-1602(+)
MFSLLSGLGIFFLLPETLPQPVPVTSYTREVLGCGDSKDYVAFPEDEVEEEEEEDESPRLVLRNEEYETPDLDRAQRSQGSQEFFKTIREMWKRKEVRDACKIYTLYSFVSIMFSEAFPLWLMTSRSAGGFAFEPKTIGMVISLSAVVLVIFQVLAFARMSRSWGNVELAAVTLLLSFLYYLQLPFLSIFDIPQGFYTIVALVGQRSLQNILNIIIFTQINIMVNNSCAPHERATVNGISMGLGSISKALGPLFAGNIYAWSLTNGLPFPFAHHLVFFFTGCLCLLFAVYTTYLSKKLNSGYSVVIPERASGDLKP